MTEWWAIYLLQLTERFCSSKLKMSGAIDGCSDTCDPNIWSVLSELSYTRFHFLHSILSWNNFILFQILNFSNIHQIMRWQSDFSDLEYYYMPVVDDKRNSVLKHFANKQVQQTKKNETWNHCKKSYKSVS